MKIGILATLTLIFIAAFYFAPHGQMKPLTATKAEIPKFALLVGINRYKKYKDINVNIRDLRGTHNDVALMKSLLADYGFKEETSGVNSDKFPCGQQTAASNVKTLCSEQATQSAIRENFKKQLIDNAKNYFVAGKLTSSDRDKGANVVFYYSGHGSKLKDVNGDESDGVDETIVAQDSDRNGVKDIIDDEFDAFYKELSQYTTNITFMFDSCHSGSVTRGGSPKSVERVIKTKNNSRGNPTLNDGINIPGNADYVTISGSLPTQESQEDLFTDTTTKQEQWDGALTYNFVNLLRQNPGLTYREIINLLRPAVTKFNQTPQVEGDIDREVFGVSATRGAVSLGIVGAPQKIKKTFDDKEVEVNQINLAVGAIVGAGKGAAIAVFATKAGDKTRQQIGSGIVTTASDFTSTAEVTLLDPNAKDLPADATVNLVSPSFNKDDKQTVALDISAGSKGAGKSKVFSDIEERLKDTALLKTIRTPNLLNSIGNSRSANSANSPEKTTDWDVAVVRGSYKDFKYGNAQPDFSKTTKSDGKGDSGDACRQMKFVGDKAVEPSDAEQGFFLINKANKMPLYNLWFSADNQNAGKCLADALEKHARIENLRNLTSGGSSLNDDVRVELVRLGSMDGINRDLAQCNAEKNTLAVKTDAGEQKQFKPNDLYYLKITNASERDLYLYIYSLTTSGAINLVYPIAGSDSSEKLPAGKTICTIQKEVLFKIDSPEVSPPGLETLKIIATKQTFPGSLLSQPEISRKGADNSPLGQLLLQNSTGKRSEAVSFAVSDWATKNINLEIVPQ